MNSTIQTAKNSVECEKDEHTKMCKTINGMQQPTPTVERKDIAFHKVPRKRDPFHFHLRLDSREAVNLHDSSYLVTAAATAVVNFYDWRK